MISIRLAMGIAPNFWIFAPQEKFFPHKGKKKREKKLKNREKKWKQSKKSNIKAIILYNNISSSNMLLGKFGLSLQILKFYSIFNFEYFFDYCPTLNHDELSVRSLNDYQCYKLGGTPTPTPTLLVWECGWKVVTHFLSKLNTPTPTSTPTLKVGHLPPWYWR